MATTVKQIEIDTEILNKISEMAKDENTTENKIINDILKKEFKNSKKEPLADKIKRLSNGKIKMLNEDTYNSNATEKELDSIIGIATAPKGFNPVKTVKEVRQGDL